MRRSGDTGLALARRCIGLDASQEMIDKVSVYKHITPDYPRTFIWCGENDKSVPPINSKMLVDELKKNDVPHKFITYPNVGHGVGEGKGSKAYGWMDIAIEYWLTNK